MKKKLFVIFLLTGLMNLKGTAQNTGFGQSNPPPQPSILGGTFPFYRGMFVDCADVIISDMVSGNLTKKTELIQYINDNSIGYVAFFGLDNGRVVGNSNPAYEAQLINLILDLRSNFPNIQLGPVCSRKSFMQQTSPIFIFDPSMGISTLCDPIQERIGHYDSLLDPKGQMTPEEIQTSEFMKSIFRAANFSHNDENAEKEGEGDPEVETFHVSEKCASGFDFIFLEIEYWYGTFSDQQLKYNTLVDACKFGQGLKCKYNCIKNIDAELNPLDIVDNSSGTPIVWKDQQSQIDELDFIIDRPSLVSYTKSSYWDITFNWQCVALRKFADRANKKHSRPMIQYSAEKPSYLKCFSNELVYEDFLGDFLDGTFAPPLGNMYDVEYEYIKKLEDNSYICPGCGCNTYTDNHWSSSNRYGNVIQGSLWFTYGLFLSQYNTGLPAGQTIFRLATTNTSDIPHLTISPNPFTDNFKIKNTGIQISKIVIHDSNYKVVSTVMCNLKDCNEIQNLLPGMYVLEINYTDGTTEFQKAICVD